MITLEVRQYFSERAQQIKQQYDGSDKSVHLDFMRGCVGQDALVNKDWFDPGGGFGHISNALIEEFNAKSVVLMEPVKEMVNIGKIAFPNEKIAWVDGSLPEMTPDLKNKKEAFDFVVMTGVWHYLSKGQQFMTLMNLAPMIKSDGHIFNLYPYPPSREGQYSVSEKATREVIESTKFDIAHFEERPYNVPANKQGAQNSKMMAFDLVLA